MIVRALSPEEADTQEITTVPTCAVGTINQFLIERHDQHKIEISQCELKERLRKNLGQTVGSVVYCSFAPTLFEQAGWEVAVLPQWQTVANSDQVRYCFTRKTA